MFNIEHYMDGRLSQYGNSYKLDVDQATEELFKSVYFKDYTEEEVIKYLNELPNGYIMRGETQQIKITKF